MWSTFKPGQNEASKAESADNIVGYASHSMQMYSRKALQGSPMSELLSYIL